MRPKWLSFIRPHYCLSLRKLSGRVIVGLGSAMMKINNLIQANVRCSWNDPSEYKAVWWLKCDVTIILYKLFCPVSYLHTAHAFISYIHSWLNTRARYCILIHSADIATSEIFFSFKARSEYVDSIQNRGASYEEINASVKVNKWYPLTKQIDGMTNPEQGFVNNNEAHEVCSVLKHSIKILKNYFSFNPLGD